VLTHNPPSHPVAEDDNDVMQEGDDYTEDDRNAEEEEEEAGRGVPTSPPVATFFARKRPRKQANPGRFYFRVMTATALV
jgi:hypothetical protein